jgi:hypothetical protein
MQVPFFRSSVVAGESVLAFVHFLQNIVWMMRPMQITYAGDGNVTYYTFLSVCYTAK